MGIEAAVLSDSIEGEARDVALVHAAIAREIAQRNQPFAKPVVLLSGGETTVTLRGKGRGGRNGKHREPELRKHDRVLRIRKTLRQQHQQFVRPVAQRDAFHVDREVLRKGSLQLHATWIGIAEGFGQRRTHRLQRTRTGTERILVRAQFRDRDAEAFPHRGQVVPGIVSAQLHGRGVDKARSIERRPGWFSYTLVAVFLIAGAYPLYWSFVMGSRDNAALTHTWPPLLPGGQVWTNVAQVLDTIRETEKFEEGTEQALEAAYDSFLDQFETSAGQSIKAGKEEHVALEDEDVEQEQIVKQKRG